MSTKTIGYILIVIGAIGFLVSLLADQLGIGSDPTAFGYRQIIGIVIGLLVLIVGIVLALRKAK